MNHSLIGLLPVLAVTGCAATTPPLAALTEASVEPSRHSFQTNILEDARKNDAYRRVLFTGARSQLVVMSIPRGGDIGLEAHPRVEQLIFIASGQGKVVVNGVERALVPGDVIVAVPTANHNVINTGTEPLQIYTVYAPANHIDARVQSTKKDAAADKADEAFGAGVR